ncbi:NUDIX domain-containing protein [Streptomyces rubrogriseus]|uniref:NUDIX domain-containing protein n=1 Tax=Streptomyces rubrogriseus TaxID=194673 RepID=UPI0037D46D12
MPEDQYAATRHAAGLGAAALLTNEVGQVLLVHPTYREDCSWVVVVADPGPRGALPMLPGGTVETTDATPEDTVHREAAEEARLTLTDPVRLGWVLDKTGEVYGGVGPNARLCLAAQVTAIGPAAVDPATGHPFARLLATPAQTAGLLGWGPPGARQAQLAADTARERWGLPAARAAAIEEIPAEGMRLS